LKAKIGDKLRDSGKTGQTAKNEKEQGASVQLGFHEAFRLSATAFAK